MHTNKADHQYQRHVLYHYNRFAHLYDLGEWLRHGTRQKAILLSGWQPGDTVLDLCTGTGTLARTFASRGATVTGVDIARGMLKRASVKAAGMNTSWVEMDATRLAFVEDAFEISVLSLALHHMPLPVQLRVLEELRRVTHRSIVIIEPDVPVRPRWIPIWTFVANIIDESEYMHEWVRQDFPGTCQAAGLQVNTIYNSTFGLHRILVCSPSGSNELRSQAPAEMHSEALPRVIGRRVPSPAGIGRSKTGQ
jgi:ubiquinone/menaquinone biosynthesis C-methylase UbiE